MTRKCFIQHKSQVFGGKGTVKTDSYVKVCTGEGHLPLTMSNDQCPKRKCETVNDLVTRSKGTGEAA